MAGLLNLSRSGAAIALGVIGFGLWAYIYLWHPGSKVDSSTAIREQMEYWTDRMEKVGAEKAYMEFKLKFSAEDITSHAFAHMFGYLLYNKLGPTGIGICDSDYAYGCFHGFFSEAVRVRGDGIVGQLDTECRKKFGDINQSCQHGIGHGLMESRGPNGLAEALEACKNTGQVFGCTAGVFMEFNIPMMLSGPADVKIGERPFDEKKPSYPCDKVKEEFRGACYFKLPQYWQLVIFKSDYGSMGRLCGNLASKEDRESCFWGIGHIIGPSSNYDSKFGAKACREMPDKEAETLCLSGLIKKDGETLKDI
jgi:hypothetical protein